MLPVLCRHRGVAVLVGDVGECSPWDDTQAQLW